MCYKIVLTVASLVVVVTAGRALEGRALPQDVLTMATNMKPTIQDQARTIFSRVYDQNPEKNRCEQFSKGFSENMGWLLKPEKCMCFKFSPSVEGGDYYIQPNKLFIQFQVPADNLHYLLFCDQKWFL